MLDVAPDLRDNYGSTGARTQVASKYLGLRNLQNSMYHGGMSEKRSWMLDTGRQRTTGTLQGAPEIALLQRKNVGRNPGISRMKWNFWERMRINFILNQCYQNFKVENAMIFGRKLKQSIRRSKKTSLPLTVGGTSGESNIAILWKDHFSATGSSVGSTDNQD